MQRDGAVVDVQRVAGDVVQEALVVRDDHRAAGVVGQELLEPADGQDVEVVGRLVEQQDVDAADQDLRQQHPQLEPARQRAQRRAVDRGGDPQPLAAPRPSAPPACSRRARRSGPPGRPSGRRRQCGSPLSAMRCCSVSAFQTTASPRIARSRMISPSSRKRSWRSTPTRARLTSATVPSDASSSPASSRMNVLLPEPLAPTRP